MFLYFMTTFDNSALKTETSWAKKVVKLILETKNLKMLVCICVVYSFWNKKIKTYTKKKE